MMRPEVKAILKPNYSKMHYIMLGKGFEEVNNILFELFPQLKPNFESYVTSFNIDFYLEMRANPKLLPSQFKKSNSYKKLETAIRKDLYQIFCDKGYSQMIDMSAFKEHFRLESEAMTKLFRNMKQQKDFTNFLANFNINTKVDYGFRYRFGQLRGNSDLKRKALLNTESSIIPTIKKLFCYININKKRHYKVKNVIEDWACEETVGKQAIDNTTIIPVTENEKRKWWKKKIEVADEAWKWQEEQNEVQKLQTPQLNTSNSSNTSIPTALINNYFESESGYNSGKYSNSMSSNNSNNDISRNTKTLNL